MAGTVVGGVAATYENPACGPGPRGWEEGPGDQSSSWLGKLGTVAGCGQPWLLGKWTELSCTWNSQSCVKMSGFWKNEGMGHSTVVTSKYETAQGMCVGLRATKLQSPLPLAGP